MDIVQKGHTGTKEEMSARLQSEMFKPWFSPKTVLQQTKIEAHTTNIVPAETQADGDNIMNKML